MNDDILTIVDDALASDLRPADVAAGSVEHLTLLLRDEAPAPRAEFVRSLDEQAARGFRARSNSSAFEPIWFWEPALFRLGAWIQRRSPATTLVAGFGIAVLLGGLIVASTDVDQPSKRSGALGGSSGVLDANDYEAVPIDAGESTGIERESLYAKGNSTTAVTATVTDYRRHVLGTGVFLEVRSGRVAGVVADAGRVARDLDGYVGDSSFNVEDTEATGRADLWVPAERVPDAMARLSKLGVVARVTEESTDVTESREALRAAIAANASRLRNLPQPRAQTDSAYVRQQRAAIANQLKLRRQRLANLDERIDVSLINLRVTGVPKAPARPPQRWSVEWSVEEGQDILRSTLSLLIVVGLGAMVPAVLVAAAWAAVMLRRRWLRRHVLDD